MRFGLPLLWMALSPTALAEESAPPPPDLTGSWKLDLRVATKADVPVLGPSIVYSVTTALVRIERRGDGWWQTHDVCDLDVQGTIALVETIIPQAFIEAFPDNAYAPTLIWDGSEWQYHADFAVRHIGYDPTQTGAQMPMEIDDAGVTDWDNDGHPGVTALLDVPVMGDVELYMVQRNRTVLDGAWTGDGVDGSATTPVLEQHTLGARPKIFARDAKIIPFPEESTFTLRRVNDMATCRTVTDTR